MFINRRRCSRKAAPVIGLTGGIAMGKSFATGMLRKCGIKVLDMDAEAHKLVAPGGKATKELLSLFPDAWDGNVDLPGVDRKKLAAIIFQDRSARKVTDAIFVRHLDDCINEFVNKRPHGKPVIIDAPLLFESHRNLLCDYVISLSAPVFVQRSRALRRTNVNAKRFQQIIGAQLSDKVRCNRADYVIHTARPKNVTLAATRKVLAGNGIRLNKNG
jgi:dephospho-CoA kinase